jgi:hypothetical protein
MRRWSWSFAVLAVVGLAACGSSSHHTATPPASTTTSTAAAGTTTTAPAATTSPTTAPSAPTTVAGPPQCATSELSGSLGGANGAAGTIYYTLRLTNTSETSCYQDGYPGVSFVSGANGHQIGAPATRVAGVLQKVTLAPGQAAAATLGIVEAANYGPACQITSAQGLRVYPPNQVDALFIAHPDQTCANTNDATLKVYPLAPA